MGNHPAPPRPAPPEPPPPPPPQRLANVAALLEWTQSDRHAVLYDSDAVGLSKPAFLHATIGRARVAVVVVTEDGDVFGYFSQATLVGNTTVADPAHFIFSFQARGRCATPARWFPDRTRRMWSAGFWAGTNPAAPHLCRCGYEGYFQVALRPSLSNYCWNLARKYAGVGDATLTGAAYPRRYVLRRLLVVALGGRAAGGDF